MEARVTRRMASASPKRKAPAPVADQQSPSKKPKLEDALPQRKSTRVSVPTLQPVVLVTPPKPRKIASHAPKKSHAAPLTPEPTPERRATRSSASAKPVEIVVDASDSEDDEADFDDPFPARVTPAPRRPAPAGLKFVAKATVTPTKSKAKQGNVQLPSPAATPVKSVSKSAAKSTVQASTPASNASSKRSTPAAHSTPSAVSAAEDSDADEEEPDLNALLLPSSASTQVNRDAGRISHGSAITQPKAAAQAQSKSGGCKPALAHLLAQTALSILRGAQQPHLPGSAFPLTKLKGKPALLADQPGLPDVEGHESNVRATLNRTVVEEEGNCLLLVGPRAVGKTAIVERSLRLLEAVHGEAAFLVVRLSGIVQTTDRLALREIARQLCSADDAIDEDGSAFSSNSATLASLLAILEPKVSSNNQRDISGKPIIFILNEFDMFALRDARQSFLYCLLDMVQSGKRRGGMAVLGLSARTDCINILEKRVKSRCQSRVLQIAPPASLDAFLAVGRASLTLDAAAVPAVSGVATKKEITVGVADWNAAVATLFASTSLQNLADRIYCISASKRDFMQELARVVSRFDQTIVAGNNAVKIVLAASPSLSSATLSDLSVAELAVLICAKHATVKDPAFNLAMAFETYQTHIKRSSLTGTHSRGFSKEVFCRAYERLRFLGVITDHSSTNRTKVTQGGVFKLSRLLPWPEQIDAAVNGRADVPQQLKKFCKTWTE